MLHIHKIKSNMLLQPFFCGFLYVDYCAINEALNVFAKSETEKKKIQYKNKIQITLMDFNFFFFSFNAQGQLKKGQVFRSL